MKSRHGYRWLLFAAALAVLSGWASHARLFWQLDESVYDRLTGGGDYPPDESLVIVAIDERIMQVQRHRLLLAFRQRPELFRLAEHQRVQPQRLAFPQAADILRPTQ